MRSILIASAVLAASGFFVPSTSYAQTYPWCAQYSGDGYGGRNCGFTTYAQCMATVSGIGGFCERNSFYTGREEQGRRHRRVVRED